jgi:hypothetical protein
LDSPTKTRDVALCQQAALEGAIILDRMEDDEARRRTR